MAKFLMKQGIKGSIVTGAVYLTIDLGLWEETDKADQVYSELVKAVSPYTTDVPLEIPDLPHLSSLSSGAQFFYNRGVIGAGEIIKDVPSQLGEFVMNVPSVLSSWGSAISSMISSTQE